MLFTIYNKRNLSTKSLFLQTWKLKWSGADSISQNFSFQVKIRECISYLSVGIHGVVNYSEPPIDPSTILFG